MVLCLIRYLLIKKQGQTAHKTGIESHTDGEADIHILVQSVITEAEDQMIGLSDQRTE